MNAEQTMSPVEKLPVVTRALIEAFGVKEYEDIRPTSGGQSSAMVYEIIVRGQPYLLKIMRAEKISDATHEFACMKTAAEAGIAPRVWYANAEDRVLITDFMEPKPYPEDVLPLIAPVLRTLHTLPGFQKPAMGSYLDTADGFIRRFQAAELLPESVTGELFQHYDTLLKVYPRDDAELVASHNDLKPQNMIYDGERIRLIDWEAAFLNDPYVDLAIVANFFVQDEADELRYLEAYFGEPAGEYARARFYLMRQILHMFYAALVLSLAARAGASIDADMTTELSFREFHRGLISGEIDTLRPDAQVQYAKVHLNEALQNMRAPRFADAVALVGAGN
jgi:thiamine kinase-like enzyme